MEQTPYWADIAFPVLSFCLTIVGPTLVASWVLFRALRGLFSSEGTAKGTTPAAPQTRSERSGS